MTKKKEAKVKDQEKKLIAYGMYCNFIQSIKHFDNMQTSFRIMASTALLATFAAIGFLFSAENKSLPIDSFVAVVLICAIGLSAIVTLWHLDLIFYEKLYISSFIELFKLEEEQKWLPQVHHNMLYGERGQDKPANVVFYYIGCGSSLILTTGITVVYLIKDKPIEYILGTCIWTILVIFLYAVFLRRRTSSLERAIKKLYPKKSRG